MTRSRRSLLIVAALVLQSSLAPPRAQPPTPPQPVASPQPPIFRTEANFVRVDVYPTRNGAPVDNLTADDFEVLEDNASQKIETFEHVVVRPAGPQTSRIEPNTVRESTAMAAEARARVFVLFLDTYHVTVDGSHDIRAPLVRMLDHLIGQDDLLGVMTPEMSAANVTFARKTTTIEGMLTRYWTWGRRESRVKDKEEEEYEQCFPFPHPDPECRNVYQGIAEEMILRRREKRTVDALIDLAAHLRGVREERKAVLAFTAGWIRYKPNERLARKISDRCGGRIPQAPGVFIGRGGRLSTRDDSDPLAPFESACERDRVVLSQLDIDRDFRDLLDIANRSNVTFYPVDPRGLAAFDSSIDTGIGIGTPPPPSVDAANLRGRLDSLRTLADNTDGIAVVDANNVDAGLKRITADLSSYYLLGYYSSNPKLDGSYRRITVRVKQPGVDVRARRGYRAATAEEVAARRGAAAPAAPVDKAFPDALSTLSTIRRDSRIRVLVAPSGDRRSLWIVGEIDPAHYVGEWRLGGEAKISILQGSAELLQNSATLAAGRRSFMTRIDTQSLPPGGYSVRVRMSAADAVPAMDSVHVDLAAETRALGTPVLFRRGPFLTLPFEPAADRRFRRNETLRVQAPLASAGAGAKVTLRDRSGKPMAIPVAARELDADDAHWVVGDITLAPLAAADYLVEVEAAGQKVVTAFTIVP